MTVTDDRLLEDPRKIQERLSQLKRLKWERRCRSEVKAWAREALRPLKQQPARHHRLLLDHLEAVARGKIDRLMVFMPPGHAKSTYSSVLFPPWFYAQRDYLDIIGASHGADLAEDFSGRIQGYIRQYEGLLGYGLRTENVQRWRTTNGGFYRAAGIGGSITGRRADGALIDDPVRSAKDAESQLFRDNQWIWYQWELYPRLKPGAWIILIMTRWNEDDLGGRLLNAAQSGGDKWVVLKLPAICDSLDDPLGRAIGEALWPEWQDEAALDRIRINSGPYVWGALYQQDPKPRGAAFFDIHDLLIPNEAGLVDAYQNTIMRPVPNPTRCDTTLAVIDTAIKSGQQHNSTAVTFSAYDRLKIAAQVTILDWDILQMHAASQSSWLDTIFVRGEELAKICGARKGFAGAFIEDKATGTVLIQQAQNKGQRVYEIDSKLTAMGKEERAIAASPYVVRGDIKISEYAFNKVKEHKGVTRNHFISQVEGFRLGSKETDGLDLLDTFTYTVSITRGTASGERKGI